MVQHGLEGLPTPASPQATVLGFMSLALLTAVFPKAGLIVSNGSSGLLRLSDQSCLESRAKHQGRVVVLDLIQSCPKNDDVRVSLRGLHQRIAPHPEPVQAPSALVCD